MGIYDGLPDGADYWWPRRSEPKLRDAECPICHRFFCGQVGLRDHLKAAHKKKQDAR